MRPFALVLALAAAAACLSAQAPGGRRLPLNQIKLPPGFAIDVFAADVPNARSLALGAKGTVFVGTQGAGSVYAVRDEDGDGQAERTYAIAKGLRMPNGVAFRDGALYVAEVSRILRRRDMAQGAGSRLKTQDSKLEIEHHIGSVPPG